MKILIENWGPIEKCEFDFRKNLIVTFGDNNIGKSYAMQITYLCLKYLIRYVKWNIRPHYIKSNEGEVMAFVLAFVKNNEQDIIDISHFLETLYGEELQQLWLQDLLEALRNRFGNFDSMLSKEPQISLFLDEKIKMRINLVKEEIAFSIARKPVRLRKTQSEFHKSRNGKENYDIYVCGSHINSPIELIHDEVAKIRKEFALEVLFRIQDVYFLPASRSGIYTGMSAFGPIMAQLSQNRAFINKPLQIPSIPETISDYYIGITGIREEEQGHFPEFAREIEEEVLKGEVHFDKKNKEIYYQPYDYEERLGMNDVSSMVSEIAPIVAYLKYIVDKNPDPFLRRRIGEHQPKAVIFIEEPEAHLHPKNQVALIKSFVHLSMENVILVIASHSNYIFNQLNNCMLAGELNESRYAPLLMTQESGKSRVSCMAMDEFGADDENFMDVSMELMDERENLIAGIIEKQGEDKRT